MGVIAASLQAADPFGERLLLAVIGPLVTVVIGGLAIKLLTDRLQARRDREAANREEQHARSVRVQEAKGRDDELRQTLVRELTEAGSSLYLATQQFGRLKRLLGDAAPESARVAFDAQYVKSRLAGEIVENRLDGYFTNSECRNAWHTVMDLLTVRYFQLIDQASPEVYAINAGPEHTGLTAEDLEDVPTVLDRYQAAMKAAVRAVFEQPLRARS